MKSFVMKKALVSVMSLLAVGALVACGNNAGGKSSGGEEENQHVLEFRPVTTGAGSTSSDVEVTIGSYKFKLGIDLEKDYTLSFYGNCTGKAQQGGGQGGPRFAKIVESEADGDEPGEPGEPGEPSEPGEPGDNPGGDNPGGDFPGGDFPGGGENPGGPGEGGQPGQGGDQQGGEQTSEPEEDYSKKNFQKAGTWKTDEWGYVLTIDSKEFHSDYMIDQYRHDFNMNVTVDDASALVHFTAYDDSFQPKDSKTFAERNAEYVFQSSASEFLFLEKDHSVVTSSYQGVSRTQTLPSDTWSLEGNVLKVGNVVAEASINTAHPGYKLNYNGKAYFCSTNASVSPLDMNNSDIYGEAELILTGSYTVRNGPTSTNYECELDLFKTGTVKFFSNGSEDASKAGTWTKTGNVYTLTLGTDEPVEMAPNADGSYTFVLMVTSQSSGPWGGGTTTTEVPLTGRIAG